MRLKLHTGHSPYATSQSFSTKFLTPHSFGSSQTS